MKQRDHTIDKICGLRNLEQAINKILKGDNPSYTYKARTIDKAYRDLKSPNDPEDLLDLLIGDLKQR